MSCIFLKGEKQKFCVAYEGMMVLSLDELEMFCEGAHYHLCEVYQDFQERGKKIPIEKHKQYKKFLGL